MSKRNGFLHAYLVLAFIYGMIGILDSILLFIRLDSLIYSVTIAIIGMLFFLLSILAIALFHHKGVKRIYYALPIYNIAAYSTYFIIGVSVAATFTIGTSLIIAQVMTSLFEVAFSFYLLTKFRKNQIASLPTPQMKNSPPPSNG